MRMKKKSLAYLLLSALILGGCKGNNTAEAEPAGEECPYEEFIVVDVFDTLANYQGIQSGWFAKIVKDKFNMELNIIAPNVAGGGTTLFQSRMAAGNLGDLIISSGEYETVQRMASAGLLLNMEPYLQDRQIMRYAHAIEAFNETIVPEGIYAIPSEVSAGSPLTPGEVVEPTFGPYVRWDLYKRLGYPQINTLDDLLPVLKQMQQLEPVAENGKKTYAFSFFRDWDENMMNAAKQPCCFYGYDEFGFVLVKADSSEYQSILDDDSMYVRSLKWFFDANQMGLVDPESVTQNYSSFVRKYEEGQLLYCPWPWTSKAVYNTTTHLEEGKGFFMVDIGDMGIYSYGCSREGNQKLVIAIGSQTQDPERMAAFVDWLYSPEGIAANQAEVSDGAAGPRGLCWDYGEDGVPYLTEYGRKALWESRVELPEGWGQGTWTDGISTLNYKAVKLLETDDRGYPYAYQLWDCVKDWEESELEKDWQQHMGADTTMEYLEKNEKLMVSPGFGYTRPQKNSEEEAIRSQCRSVIQKYSWEMIFAEDEETFYRLLSRMQKETENLGYDSVLELDLKNAKEMEAARWENVKKYEEGTS